MHNPMCSIHTRDSGYASLFYLIMASDPGPVGYGPHMPLQPCHHCRFQPNLLFGDNHGCQNRLVILFQDPSLSSCLEFIRLFINFLGFFSLFHPWHLLLLLCLIHSSITIMSLYIYPLTN